MTISSAGLVDSATPDEFDYKLDNKRGMWEMLVPGFHKWLTESKRDVFVESYLLPKRLEIGDEGRGRVTNNDSEKLNALIKEQFLHQRQPIQKAVRLLERFVDG